MRERIRARPGAARAARLPRLRAHRLRGDPLHGAVDPGRHRHGDRHASLLRRRCSRPSGREVGGPGRPGVLRILRTMFAVGIFDNDYSRRRSRCRSTAPSPGGPGGRHHAPTATTRRLPSTSRRGSVARDRCGRQHPPLGGSADVRRRTRSRCSTRCATARPEIGVRSAAPGNDPVNGANMIETADMTAVPSSVLTPETAPATA